MSSEINDSEEDQSKLLWTIIQTAELSDRSDSIMAEEVKESQISRENESPEKTVFDEISLEDSPRTNGFLPVPELVPKGSLNSFNGSILKDKMDDLTVRGKPELRVSVGSGQENQDIKPPEKEPLLQPLNIKAQKRKGFSSFSESSSQSSIDAIIGLSIEDFFGESEEVIEARKQETSLLDFFGQNFHTSGSSSGEIERSNSTLNEDLYGAAPFLEFPKTNPKILNPEEYGTSAENEVELSSESEDEIQTLREASQDISSEENPEKRGDKEKEVGEEGEALGAGELDAVEDPESPSETPLTSNDEDMVDDDHGAGFSSFLVPFSFSLSPPPIVAALATSTDPMDENSTQSVEKSPQDSDDLEDYSVRFPLRELLKSLPDSVKPAETVNSKYESPSSENSRRNLPDSMADDQKKESVSPETDKVESGIPEVYQTIEQTQEIDKSQEIEVALGSDDENKEKQSENPPGNGEKHSQMEKVQEQRLTEVPPDLSESEQKPAPESKERLTEEHDKSLKMISLAEVVCKALVHALGFGQLANSDWANRQRKAQEADRAEHLASSFYFQSQVSGLKAEEHLVILESIFEKVGRELEALKPKSVGKHGGMMVVLEGQQVLPEKKQSWIDIGQDTLETEQKLERNKEAKKEMDRAGGLLKEAFGEWGSGARLFPLIGTEVETESLGGILWEAETLSKLARKWGRIGENEGNKPEATTEEEKSQKEAEEREMEEIEGSFWKAAGDLEEDLVKFLEASWDRGSRWQIEVLRRVLGFFKLDTLEASGQLKFGVLAAPVPVGVGRGREKDFKQSFDLEAYKESWSEPKHSVRVQGLRDDYFETFAEDEKVLCFGMKVGIGKHRNRPGSVDFDALNGKRGETGGVNPQRRRSVDGATGKESTSEATKSQKEAPEKQENADLLLVGTTKPSVSKVSDSRQNPWAGGEEKSTTAGGDKLTALEGKREGPFTRNTHDSEGNVGKGSATSPSKTGGKRASFEMFWEVKDEEGWHPVQVTESSEIYHSRQGTEDSRIESRGERNVGLRRMASLVRAISRGNTNSKELALVAKRNGFPCCVRPNVLGD